MTKNELVERWINDWSQDYIFTGNLEEDRENFYNDLEDWYNSRHIRELDAIKTGIVKSLSELDCAVEEMKNDETRILAKMGCGCERK